MVKSEGKLIRPAQDVFWGGYSGYFADPDGHLWEVAWNPHFWPGPKDEVKTKHNMALKRDAAQRPPRPLASRYPHFQPVIFEP